MRQYLSNARAQVWLYGYTREYLSNRELKFLRLLKLGRDRSNLAMTTRGSTPKSKFGKILGLFGAIRGDYLGPFLAFWGPIMVIWVPILAIWGPISSKIPVYPSINGYKRAIAPNAAPSGMFDRPVCGGSYPPPTTHVLAHGHGDVVRP